MKDDRRDNLAARTPQAPPEKPRARSGRLIRAAVVGAIAALAPAAGCWESEPTYGIPFDAADAGDDGSGEAAAEDAAVEDASTDWPLPPYGAPEYGAPDYGVP